MTDFREILDQLADGSLSLDSVQSWIDDAVAEHKYAAAELLDILAETTLPEDQLQTLQEQVRDLSAQEEREHHAPFPDIGDLSLLPMDEESRKDTGEDAGEQADAEPEDAESTLRRLRAQASGQADAGRDAEPSRSGNTSARESAAEEPSRPDDEDAPPTEYAPPERDPAEEPTLLAEENGGNRTDIGEAATNPRSGATTGGSWPGAGGGTTHKNIGPGTILKERFELVTAIGEGGMGTVYKARDLLKVEAKDRNPFIAVKLLTGDFREHPESFIALQRESSKAQRLAHPNIATVYDFDRDGSTVFMTMELLEGKELSRVIKKLPPGGLPPEEALQIIQQLCEGLAYAHNRGLVHSDLKPGNAYLTREKNVKLLDFGIARASKTRADASGEVTLFDPGQLGALTPAYATIEMFDGLEPDPRDDIYALACISYELLSGKHPFNKLSAVKVKEKGLSASPVPKLSKRQNRALMQALALDRNARTATVEEFWDQLRPRKNYTGAIVATGLAALLLLSLGGYYIFLPWLERQQHESLIQDIRSQGPPAVPALLESLQNYDAQARRFILDGAKDTIIRYYENRAEALVDPAQGNYDYPAAMQLVKDLLQYYPDSAQVTALQESLRNRKSSLVAEQARLFDQYLEEGRLLPIEGESDITDVVTRLRQADPGNPLLNDARLATRYAEMARSAVKDGEYSRAADILEIALAYSADDPALVNLNDQVKRELERQANAARVAELKNAIQPVLSSGTTAQQMLSVKQQLLELQSLRPDDPDLATAMQNIRTSIAAKLGELIADAQWMQAEALLLDAAPLLETGFLLRQRELLSGAEVQNAFQLPSISKHLEDLTAKRETVKAQLAEAKFTDDWHIRLRSNFLELIALLRPGNLWFDQLREELASRYVRHAEQLLAENRFDAANRWLDRARNFAPALPAIASLRDRVAEAETAFQAAEAARLRDARIAALKNQLRVQTEAGEVRQAESTLRQLRNTLPENDEFLVATAPRLLAAAYLDLAENQAEAGNFGDAAVFARRAGEIAPDYEPARQALAEYQRQALRVTALQAAENATPQTLSRLPGLLKQAREASPRDATAIEQQLMQGLAERIRSLESYDAVMANRLLARSRELFPDSRALADISLRPPPTPSRYVPDGREALQDGMLSKAAEILAEARKNEPDNEQVEAFARELEAARAEANRHYLNYQQALRAGRRDQARVYLEEAMRKWRDNPQFQAEFQSTFATTRAPARAEDGSRPCTAQLAGYGAQGRAECFDMIDGQQGPVLVVIPEGGGNPAPYAIGKYEISVGEYNRFCAATGCDRLAGENWQPATGMSYSRAREYTNWLSRKTGKEYRLPDAEEWTHAARAGNPDAVRDVNCRVSQGGQILKGMTLLDVRTGRENPWGLVNFMGNVQEWVNTDPVTVRGGNYTDSLSDCAITLTRVHDKNGDSLTGFRVARSLGGSS